jgi:hypothetical protein
MNKMRSCLLAGFFLGAFLLACTNKPASTSATPTTSSTPAATDKVAVIVTVSDSRPINDVVADLKKQGLEVDNVMDKIGSVSGHVASSSMSNLKSVSGVTAVELDRPVSAQ